MADANYGAIGGVPSGGMTPEQVAEFWKQYQAAQDEAGRTSEMAKNVPAAFAPAPAVTPGPEAFKHASSLGGTSLSGYDPGGDWMNRAVTQSAVAPTAIANLGLRGLETGLNAAGYPSETITNARRSVENAGRDLATLREEQNKNAGIAPSTATLLDPTSWTWNPTKWDWANLAGGLPTDLILGGVGGKAAEVAASRLAPGLARAVSTPLTAASTEAERELALSAAKKLATAKAAGASVGMGLGQPVEGLKPIPANATPAEKAAIEAENEKTYWATQALRAPVNALIGGGAHVAMNTVGNRIGGIISPDARLLQDEGVRVVADKSLGPTVARAGGLVNSLPLTGAARQQAEAREQRDLLGAFGRRALRDFGEAPPPPAQREGAGLMTYLYQAANRAYDRVLTPAVAPMDHRFFNDISANLYQAGANELPPDLQKSLTGILNRSIGNRMTNSGGPLNGRAIKDIETELRSEANTFGKSPLPYDQRMAKALNAVHSTLIQHVEDTNPGLAPQLRAVNRGYATYKQAQYGMNSRTAAAQDGRLTPQRAMAAVQHSDTSVGGRDFVENRVLNQDLAGAASRVLSAKENDSGSAQRGAFIALFHGLVGGGAGMATAGQTIAADVVGSLLYTRPGQAILRGIISGRGGGRGALGNAVRTVGPYGAIIAAQSPQGREAISNAEAEAQSGPAYQSFGGAKNAQEAARQYFDHGQDIPAATKAINALSPSQKADFSSAYATNFVNHVMNSKEPRAALNGWMSNPQARLHMDAALGTGRARQLEATIRLEALQGIVPLYKDAANATALGVSKPLGDFHSVLTNAIRHGGDLAGKKFSDASIEKVAALITSKDPNQYAKGVAQLADSPMADALRAYDRHLVAKGVTQDKRFILRGGEPETGAVQPGAQKMSWDYGQPELQAIARREAATSSSPTAAAQALQLQGLGPEETPPAPGAIRVEGKEGWYKKEIDPTTGNVQWFRYKQPNKG